jgi:hypothetical protein
MKNPNTVQPTKGKVGLHIASVIAKLQLAKQKEPKKK